MQTHLGGYKLSISGKSKLFFLVGEGKGKKHLHKGKFMPSFKEIAEGRELFLHVDCQLPLA